MKTTTNIQSLTPDTFDTVVSSNSQRVLVDFWAGWCGPCKMINPTLEAFAAEQGETLTVTKLNVDDAPSVAAKFEIRSIPTLILFENGVEVKRSAGVMPINALRQTFGV